MVGCHVSRQSLINMINVINICYVDRRVPEAIHYQVAIQASGVWSFDLTYMLRTPVFTS